MDFLTNFTEEISANAERILIDVFPQKVVELDKHLEDPEFGLKSLEKIRACSWMSMGVQQGEGNRLTSNENLQSMKSKDSLEIKIVNINQANANFMDQLRLEITSLMDYCNTLRLWVTLLLPKIEDGNNFGRSVQEETVHEIQNAECEATGYLGQISTYFLTRAKIAGKIIKYPHIQDYYRYIAEEDEKQFVNFRLMLFDIRNTYSSIHDLILKNIEKIKKPMNSNFSNMY